MEANYVHKDSTSLVQENKELKLELSGYRQAILEDKDMLGLKEENQELKQKYLNAVADYETTMFEKEQLNSLVNSCQEEIRRLKKQLEDMTLCRDIASGHRKEVQDRETILLNQQKEFISYLENMLDDENDIFSVVRVKDVLQKYKSIIGVLDEKSNNISS